MIFKTLVAVYFLLNGIVIHIEWKRIENLEKWMLHLLKQTNKDEPQTDCGDFADRLAYERGVKHAWGLAQKVFGSKVTFYEAKQIADTPQTEQTEPKGEA